MVESFGDSISKKVVEEHNCIKRDLDRIKETIKIDIPATKFDEWKMEYLWRLRDFRNHLLKHFDLEETGGFMMEIMSRAPEVTNTVKFLKNEHGHIIHLIDGIILNLKAMEMCDGTCLGLIKKDIDSFVALVRKHESKENEIVQQAFYQDYGYPS